MFNNIWMTANNLNEWIRYNRRTFYGLHWQLIPWFCVLIWSDAIMASREEYTSYVRRQQNYKPLPINDICMLHHNDNKALRLEYDWVVITSGYTPFNTLRPRQNGRHFPDDIFKWIPWMEMNEFRLTFHWSLFLGVPLTIFQHWFR